MKSFILCFLFYLGLAASLFAQQEYRQFRVVTSLGPIKELKYDFEGEPKDIIVQGWMSQPYPMPEGELRLYRLVPPPPGSPPGTPLVPQVITSLKIPSKMNRALVVMIRNESGKYFARLFDDSFEKHGAGQVRMINFSSMSAAINIKGELAQAEPGEATFVPYDSGPLRVKVAVENSRQWEIVYLKSRIAYPNLRAYSLIFNYEADPRLGLDPSVAPPSALVRFYTEKVPDPALQ